MLIFLWSAETLNSILRFCRFHGENRPAAPSIPREIVCCAEVMIPHLLRVFVRALRIDNISGMSNEK